jgi:hypothetical protein
LIPVSGSGQRLCSLHLSTLPPPHPRTITERRLYIDR